MEEIGEETTWPVEEPAAEDEAVPLADEDVPDWLRSLQAVQEEADVADLEELGVSAEPELEEGEVPDWLTDLERRAPGVTAEVEEQGTPPVQPAESRPEEPAPPEPTETPAPVEGTGSALEDLDDDTLAPAELPSWLRAMRPVEAVTPVTPAEEDVNREAEGVGPLAGLQGVLPAEPEIVHAGAPASYSGRVDITEKQQKNIDLLKQLIGSETEPYTVSAGRLAFQPIHLLRWVIALLLILAVGLPLYTLSQSAPLPAQTPQPALDVSTLMSRLPTSAPVLIAFDYQPGLSAEVETAAVAVVDHLMLQRARLTLVSTSPTGPLLAARFMRDPQGIGANNFRPGVHYVNLGFIPGGAAGLQDFANSPRQTIPAPFDREGVPEGGTIWTNSVVGDIQSIRNFAMVLVLVDDPQTARAWIEQIGPQLGGIPLVMVLSAQAEPLVRPYYLTAPRQVAGYVAGIAGGAAYERITARTTATRTYWDAFRNGTLLAGVIILGGAVYGLIASLTTGGARKPIEEPS